MQLLVLVLHNDILRFSMQSVSGVVCLCNYLPDYISNSTFFRSKPLLDQDVFPIINVPHRSTPLKRSRLRFQIIRRRGIFTSLLSTSHFSIHPPASNLPRVFILMTTCNIPKKESHVLTTLFKAKHFRSEEMLIMNNANVYCSAEENFQPINHVLFRER